MIKPKRRQRSEWLTPALFAVVYAFLVVLIFQSRSRPLWYDEVTRAYMIDNNFHIPLDDNQGLAPIALGVYAITKFAVLFADNNFTQRITTYLALLLLPIVVYKFATIYFDVRMARVMLVLSVLSGYILEFSSQNKPYMLDIVCMLGLLVVYKLYANGKVKTWHMIGASLLSVLFSFGAFFVLGGLAIITTVSKWRGHNTRSWRDIITWLGGTGLPALLYVALFLKPQASSKLYGYYSNLSWHHGFIQLGSAVFGSVADIFGFAFYQGVGQGWETNAIFWTTQQLRIAHKPPVVGFSLILGWLWMAFFIYGCVLAYKRGQRVLVYLLGIMTVLEAAATLTGHWAFGDVRLNLFTLFLMTLLMIYGGATFTATQIRHHRLVPLALIFFVMLAALPVQTIGDALTGNATFSGGPKPYQGIETGGQGIAIYVASHSRANDVVLVDFQVRQYPFRYCYEYCDYTQVYRAGAARTVSYGTGYYERSLDRRPLQAKPERVWLVALAGETGDDVKRIEHYGYHAGQLTTRGDISTVLLTKKVTP